jgi:hypothetical protein
MASIFVFGHLCKVIKSTERKKQKAKSKKQKAKGKRQKAKGKKQEGTREN